MSEAKQEIALLLSNEEIIPGIHRIRVKATHCAAHARPGQFIMLRCDDSYQRMLRRPISINDHDHDSITFLFKTVGPGTSWLAQRQPNDQLDLLGPLGNGFRIEPEWQNILLVAGGLGIAPLINLANSTIAFGRKVTLLQGANCASQLFPEHLLSKSIKTISVTEDGSTDNKGMVTDFISDYLVKADAVFSCGPVPMYKTILRLTRDMSYNKPIQVSLETRMGCGLGGCLSCSVKTSTGMKRVCREGPVFDLREIDWDWVTI